MHSAPARGAASPLRAQLGLVVFVVAVVTLFVATVPETLSSLTDDERSSVPRLPGDAVVTWTVGGNAGRHANRLNVMLVGAHFARRHQVRIAPPALDDGCAGLCPSAADAFDLHAGHHHDSLLVSAEEASRIAAAVDSGCAGAAASASGSDDLEIIRVPGSVEQWRQSMLGSLRPQADNANTKKSRRPVYVFHFTALWDAGIARYRVGTFLRAAFVGREAQMMSVPRGPLAAALEAAMTTVDEKLGGHRSLLGVDTIGVHLRGEDFLLDCPLFENWLYPSTLYYRCWVDDAEYIAGEIERAAAKHGLRAGAFRVLATTNFPRDSAVIRGLQDRFGDRLILPTFMKKKQKRPQRNANSSSSGGSDTAAPFAPCLGAAVDMELLGRTAVFLGNHWSSYTTVVAARRNFERTEFFEHRFGSVPALAYAIYCVAVGATLLLARFVPSSVLLPAALSRRELGDESADKLRAAGAAPSAGSVAAGATGLLRRWVSFVVGALVRPAATATATATQQEVGAAPVSISLVRLCGVFLLPPLLWAAAARYVVRSEPVLHFAVWLLTEVQSRRWDNVAWGVSLLLVLVVLVPALVWSRISAR